MSVRGPCFPFRCTALFLGCRTMSLASSVADRFDTALVCLTLSGKDDVIPAAKGNARERRARMPPSHAMVGAVAVCQISPLELIEDISQLYPHDGYLVLESFSPSWSSIRSRNQRRTASSFDPGNGDHNSLTDKPSNYVQTSRRSSASSASLTSMPASACHSRAISLPHYTKNQKPTANHCCPHYRNVKTKTNVADTRMHADKTSENSQILTTNSAAQLNPLKLILRMSLASGWLLVATSRPHKRLRYEALRWAKPSSQTIEETTHYPEWGLWGPYTHPEAQNPGCTIPPGAQQWSQALPLQSFFFFPLPSLPTNEGWTKSSCSCVSAARRYLKPIIQGCTEECFFLQLCEREKSAKYIYIYIRKETFLMSLSVIFLKMTSGQCTVQLCTTVSTEGNIYWPYSLTSILSLKPIFTSSRWRDCVSNGLAHKRQIKRGKPWSWICVWTRGDEILKWSGGWQCCKGGRSLFSHARSVWEFGGWLIQCHALDSAHFNCKLFLRFQPQTDTLTLTLTLPLSHTHSHTNTHTLTHTWGQCSQKISHCKKDCFFRVGRVGKRSNSVSFQHPGLVRSFIHILLIHAFVLMISSSCFATQYLVPNSNRPPMIKKSVGGHCTHLQ